MRRFALLIIPFALVAVLAVGCGSNNGGGSGTNGIPTGAIATVGSGVVTQADFDQIINQAKKQAESQKQTFPKPDTYDYNQYAAQVIDYLVQLQLIEQAAPGMKVSVTDKQVSDQIAKYQKQYGGQAKFAAALKAQGLALSDLNKLIHDQLLSQGVYNNVTAAAKVTDAQALAYYNQHKSTFTQPEQRHVRHILVKTKAEALKVRALLVGGASWKTVAAKYSTDASNKDKGGDLGEVKPGQMVPPFDKAAFSLPLNTISQPVKSTFGWHIIEVLSITKAKVQTFKQMEPSIKTQLTTTKAQELWKNWLAKQTKAATIKYANGFDPTVLRKTKPPTAAPSATSAPTTSGSAEPSPNPTNP